MSIPTKGETFAKLTEHLRLASEDAAMLAHLVRDDDALLSKGWLGIAELLQRMIHQVTTLATRGLQ